MEKLLTPKEVAQLFGLSESWVREHSRPEGPRPRIPAAQMGSGGRWRYSEAAIERWLRELGIERTTTK
jgi:predicted DNA-binding transcriptional regulator AlpA